MGSQLFFASSLPSPEGAGLCTRTATPHSLLMGQLCLGVWQSFASCALSSGGAALHARAAVPHYLHAFSEHAYVQVLQLFARSGNGDPLLAHSSSPQSPHLLCLG